MDNIEISRSNWRCLAILLMVVIVTFISMLFGFHMGENGTKERIYRSGYSIIEIHTATNTCVLVEKRTNGHHLN